MSNAGLGRRFGAILYDALLVFALMCLGTLPFVGARGGDIVEPGTLRHQLTMLLLCYLFFVGFWSGYGRTLGMQSWRLRIETVDGCAPGIGQSSLRFFAAILSWLPAGLGFWWQLVDNDNLALHDRLSGTRLRFYPATAGKAL
ncbi:MAG: RDD family protein [Woeseia sp.]